MKRLFITLSFLVLIGESFAQNTFYKPHGVHRIHRISSTNHVLESSNAFHAAWRMGDYDGGSPLSTVARIVLGNYDKQGNFISEFEVLPNQHNSVLLGAELIADSLFIFQVNSNIINPKLICFNSTGVKKWETANSDIYNHFKVKDTTIITIVSKDTGTASERTNLALYSGFDFTLQDTLNIEDIKNAYFPANNNMQVKGLEISEKYIVLFFENDSTKESEFLFFDFNFNYVKIIKGNENVFRFFIWDEDIVARYESFENLISFFSHDTTKNWDFANPFTEIPYKTIPVFFHKKNEYVMVLYDNTRSSPYNTQIHIFIIDNKGNIIDTFNLDQSDPRIVPFNFIKTDDGYFFQTIRSWGNNYERWICKVDSCFSTNSTDFTVNLQNENCFQGTNIGFEELTVLETFSIYPNPTSSHLNISTEQTTQTTYTLYSITGKKIQNASFNLQTQLDVSQLPNGLYILKLENEGTTQTMKLIKQ
jgi:hypothetical protein